ncbi:hypothetical protein JHN53_22800 [Streptomyces sp. MBT58]|uniref:hypothetical protein n=1 Tax=Streptomyces sp. MBT58 TaxID=1488389 RepID=UPI001913DBC5|nr:hypothetical protein [Streptomyces sp. MBT58]MBK5994423.1 hypothetical protein [Streptomyces sp. MBT58]
MSLALVVHCDLSDRYGSCAAYLPTGTTDEAKAYATAQQIGWSVAPDRCPAHSHRPRPVPSVRRLRPRTTKETPTP